MQMNLRYYFDSEKRSEWGLDKTCQVVIDLRLYYIINLNFRILQLALKVVKPENQDGRQHKQS